MHEFKPIINEDDHPTYEGACDHPRLLQHCAIRPVSWQANCDTQPIINQDLLKLMKYVTGYACKGAATTSDLLRMYKTILNSSEANTTLTSVAQKLLLKTVGIVDMPAPASDFMNIKNKLYRSSRKYNKVGLSGFRVLNDDPDENNRVSKSSVLDKFLGEERKHISPNITLWDWAKRCTCPASHSCGQDHVPVFTGFNNYISWPVSEEYATVVQLCTVDDIFHGDMDPS